MTIYNVRNGGAGGAEGVRVAHPKNHPSQRPGRVEAEQASRAGDRVALSPAADAVARAASLRAGDPAQLGALAEPMANKLHPRNEGEDEGAWLERLSDRLARVAESGDLQAATLDRASVPPAEPEVLLRGGRGDGAELAWAGVLSQIGDAMAQAQRAATSQSALSAKPVADASKVGKVTSAASDSRSE